MSYCEIVTFERNKAVTAAEYGNSHGGQPRIWDCLYNKYVKDHRKEHDSWLFGNTKALWALADRKDLPLFERAVMAFTFDYATVEKANFKRFAGHLREFVTAYPVPGRVDHLPSWAKFFDECTSKAIGLYGTSLSDNPWFEWDEKKERDVPYNLKSGTKHFEIYEDLES